MSEPTEIVFEVCPSLDFRSGVSDADQFWIDVFTGGFTPESVFTETANMGRAEPTVERQRLDDDCEEVRVTGVTDRSVEDVRSMSQTFLSNVEDNKSVAINIVRIRRISSEELSPGAHRSSFAGPAILGLGAVAGGIALAVAKKGGISSLRLGPQAHRLEVDNDFGAANQLARRVQQKVRCDRKMVGDLASLHRLLGRIQANAQSTQNRELQNEVLPKIRNLRNSTESHVQRVCLRK